MSSRNIAIVVALLIILAGGWYLLNNKNNSSTYTPVESTSPAVTEESSPAATPMQENMVKITSSGFSPATIRIKAGGSVTFMNDDSVNHQVNSDPHPTHGLFPMLNLGVIKPGESKSAMFEKSGTYTYHDHLHPTLTGTVVVQ